MHCRIQGWDHRCTRYQRDAVSWTGGIGSNGGSRGCSDDEDFFARHCGISSSPLLRAANKAVGLDSLIRRPSGVMAIKEFRLQAGALFRDCVCALRGRMNFCLRRSYVEVTMWMLNTKFWMERLPGLRILVA